MTIEENVASRKEAESLFKFMLELVKDEFFKLPERGRINFYEIAHAHFEKRVQQFKNGTLMPRAMIEVPAPIAKEQNQLVEDALKMLGNLIEICETHDFPPAGEDFAESVADGARSMLETIEERNIVTPEQERAIHNWTDGIPRVVSMMLNETYLDFITSKVRRAKPVGFHVDLRSLPPSLFNWQKRTTQWSLKLGRSAMFEDTGLGKTAQQLAWAEQVHHKTRQPVVLHTTLGVRGQTKRESEKFGIRCKVEVVDEPSHIVDGINLINYEKMHHFDSSIWGGVVLDESSCLKNFTGKTKRQLIESYSQTPYRLACTATPAPNDHMELGNHADFLGVMPSNEMLSRWFFNDTMNAGGYRLKGHAVKDFWMWVSSWAICLNKPSDIGGDDTGYDLPPMEIIRHVVSVPFDAAAEGFLIDVHGISATNIHEEKRRTNVARSTKTAEIARDSVKDGPVLIWCHTDYEADEIKRQLPEAIEVRGSHKESYKESTLAAFARGEIPILITKPSIAGMGLNFQCCSTQIFGGISFSFEDYYQAVRRSYRFGQTKNVTIHLVISESESMIEKTIARKESDHYLMHSSMSNVVRDFGLSIETERMRDSYNAFEEIQLPNFLKEKLCV